MGKADRYRHLKYRRVSGAVVYRRLSLTRRACGSDRRDPAAAGDAPRLVRRPAALALLAVFSAIAGILGMAMLLLSPHTVLDPLGIGAAFLGAISMALGTWLSRRWALSLPIVALTGWQLTIGGVVLAPVALIVDPPLHQVTVLQAAGYLWLCLAGAMLAYGLWFRGIGRLSPVAVSAMSLLSPVTAVVLGWIFLGQKIQGMALMGLIVVLASVMSIQRALARQAAGAKTKKAP